MIPYLGCDAAREMLEAFVDGELPMADQVALESHLRWCATCGARVEDMRLIGVSIRLRAPVQDPTLDELPALAVIQSEVLTRIRAERDQSLPVRLREVFEDMHFLWPALGATAALVGCLIAATSVLQAARDDRPDSLAAMMETLAAPPLVANMAAVPLSAYYPVRLDDRILAPRALDHGPTLESIPEEEVAFALDAVVTREGRVADYELLQSERAGVLRHRNAARTEDVDALLDAVKRSRFEPAQSADGGAVTVRVVWVLARTTVKASIGADLVKRLNDRLTRLAPRPARS